MKRIADTELVLPPPKLPARAHWQASLSLGFSNDAGTTRLTERTHSGPLLVQKPLYPEGKTVCHAIVIHPPGGVVGGDQLAINARVGDQASALITTPGAAKWYKANGHISRQKVTLALGAQAALEWLPQETIFFNHAHVALEHSVVMSADASYIGSEILCFGRTASGESFDAGHISQCTSIRRAGKLIWFEQGVLSGESAAMQSPTGLHGKTVCATLIAVGNMIPAALIQAIREDALTLTDDAASVGVTQMKSLVVVRYLGDSSEIARQVVTLAWQRLRPALLKRQGLVPRIWNT